MSITLSPGSNCIESLSLKSGVNTLPVFSKALGVNSTDWVVTAAPSAPNYGTGAVDGTIQIHDYTKDRGNVAWVILNELKTKTTGDASYGAFFKDYPTTPLKFNHTSATALPASYVDTDEANLLSDLARLKISDKNGCHDTRKSELVFNYELDLSAGLDVS